jgi:hypothetical protein
MFRTVIAAAAVATLSISFASAAKAQSLTVDQTDDEYEYSNTVIPTPAQGQAQDRLLIVNGNNGHVVYDDGRDDLFCVTRRYVAYYNYYGRPVYRRTIRCR